MNRNLTGLVGYFATGLGFAFIFSLVKDFNQSEPTTSVVQEGRLRPVSASKKKSPISSPTDLERALEKPSEDPESLAYAFQKISTSSSAEDDIFLEPSETNAFNIEVVNNLKDHPEAFFSEIRKQLRLIGSSNLYDRSELLRATLHHIDYKKQSYVAEILEDEVEWLSRQMDSFHADESAIVWHANEIIYGLSLVSEINHDLIIPKLWQIRSTKGRDSKYYSDISYATRTYFPDSNQ